MSIAGRIDELSNKHRQLDTQIIQAQKHAAADGLMINTLKRKKLKIKEELQLLKAS
ncbi:MAG: YdcH family protein [Hyphomonas sp.]